MRQSTIHRSLGNFAFGRRPTPAAHQRKSHSQSTMQSATICSKLAF